MTARQLQSPEVKRRKFLARQKAKHNDLKARQAANRVERVQDEEAKAKAREVVIKDRGPLTWVADEKAEQRLETKKKAETAKALVEAKIEEQRRQFQKERKKRKLRL